MAGLLNQTDAASFVGVTRITLIRWEKRGLIHRAKTKRPGAWYSREALAPFLVTDSYTLRLAASSGCQEEGQA